jgi:hypothetical protein
VTASLAWKPTLAKVCMMMSDWMSILNRISSIRMRHGGKENYYVSVCKYPI